MKLPKDRNGVEALHRKAQRTSVKAVARDLGVSRAALLAMWARHGFDSPGRAPRPKPVKPISEATFRADLIESGGAMTRAYEKRSLTRRAYIRRIAAGGLDKEGRDRVQQEVRKELLWRGYMLVCESVWGDGGYEKRDGGWVDVYPNVMLTLGGALIHVDPALHLRIRRVFNSEEFWAFVEKRRKAWPQLRKKLLEQENV